jgi:hypothetical protein
MELDDGTGGCNRKDPRLTRREAIVRRGAEKKQILI